MNYRKRRANAWAGLYVGLVGADTRADGDEWSDDQDGPTRHERRD